MSAKRPDHERRQAREHVKAGLILQLGRARRAAASGLVSAAAMALGFMTALGLAVAGIAQVVLMAALGLCFSAAGMDRLSGAGRRGDEITEWAYDPRAQALAVALFVAAPLLTALACWAWERARPARQGLPPPGGLTEGLRWGWITQADRQVKSAAERGAAWGHEVFDEAIEGSAKALIPLLWAALSLPVAMLGVFSCAIPGAALASGALAAQWLGEGLRGALGELKTKGAGALLKGAAGGLLAPALALGAGLRKRGRAALERLEREGADSDLFREREARELGKSAAAGRGGGGKSKGRL